MKKLKQTILLATVMVVAASTMAGCGKEDGKQSGKLDDTETTTENTSGDAVATTDMSIDEYIDYYAADVTLGQYNGIEYRYAPVKATDADVQAEVQKLIDSKQSFEEDYESEAKIGDIVNIDFVGSVDGVEFEGGNTHGSGYDIQLGSHAFIDDFEDQIVGHVPGETFNVEVTFPENYRKDDDSLNGKDAVFVTTLNYIEVPVEVEYNDEFVAANTSYSNVADYEESIYNSITASNEAYALASAQDLIMTNVITNAVVANIPEDEVNTLIDNLIASITDEAKAYGLDYETYVNYYYGFEDTDIFYENVVAVCNDSVKEKKVVCAIAKAENITITSEEEDAYVAKLASDYGVTEDVIRDYYAGEDLMYYALAEKVMDFLMDNGVEVNAEE